jgi:hypothetical protein
MIFNKHEVVIKDFVVMRFCSEFFLTEYYCLFVLYNDTTGNHRQNL